MDKSESNPSSVTSLAVGEVPYNYPSFGSDPPAWEAPFIELLALLKIVDISQPYPQLKDHCFRFQPSLDLSEIARTFISVSTSVVKYDIDLKTLRCSESGTVPPAVTKLQEFANQVLRKKQAFRDRLLESGVIENIDGFLDVDLFTCPLCLQPLITCIDCDSIVACAREECPAFLVTPCKFCSDHLRMACHACLDASGSIPSLIICETCQRWRCRSDVEWCAGLVVRPAPGTEEFENLSHLNHWDCKSIVRSHPPRPGPCVFCTDLSPPGWERCAVAEIDLEPRRCPSHPPFVTALHLRSSHCPECIEQRPGCHCACDDNWICDACVTFGNTTLDCPCLITCPRCGVNYCTDPDSGCADHAEMCKDCKGVAICNNCEEEEEIPGDVHFTMERPEEVVLSNKCNQCGFWICTDCVASRHNATCADCGSWFCYDCIHDENCQVTQRCYFCGVEVCKRCESSHTGTCSAFPMHSARLPRHTTTPQGIFLIGQRGPPS